MQGIARFLGGSGDLVSDLVKVPKASDLVVDALRRRILSERLPVGSRLASEAELIEQFGVGRVSVREALRILERDGLVDIRRGATGGIYVREVGVEQVSDALALMFSTRDTSLGEFADFRLQLEPTVARLAAENATAAQRDELRGIAERPSDGAQVADFHGLVAAASGNGVHEVVLSALRSALQHQVRYELVGQEYSQHNVREHVAIAEAIAEGRADDAERTMRTHLEGYRDFIAQAGLLDGPIIPRDLPSRGR